MVEIRCDASLLASALGLIASTCTLGLGVVYLILRFQQTPLAFARCDFAEADCNWRWRQVFTLNPVRLLDQWTPILFGVLGMAVHLRHLKFCKFESRLLPNSYLQYSAFLAVATLFANFGYCGRLGVLVGSLDLLAALSCLAAWLMGETVLKGSARRICRAQGSCLGVGC